MLIILAPGSYSPEKSHTDSTPKYSFGLKTIYEKVNDNPAPCAYKPEKKTKLYKKQSYSFGQKVNHEKPSQTPGEFLYKLLPKYIVISNTIFILQHQEHIKRKRFDLIIVQNIHSV